ncbi:glycosyltransferase [Porifericola rhodea]|uniref:glycosyltransferase n=1 Tax=Porifericola rhodea TaxID=930972 RepID=UPI0026662EEE|nr:glycosyltransferase [Porifericola rhodea]WKN33482.1 glycosyltransferase [Porifericola rhodea]
MKRIAFVSTMAGFSWGGSENFWAKSALEALQQGYTVFISVYTWKQRHPLLQKLQDSGAIIHFRKRYDLDSAIISKALNKVQKEYLNFSSFKKALNKFQPDVICISQGGNYDIVQEKAVYKAVQHSDIPYYIVPQFNQEHYTLPYKSFQEARKIFSRAKGVCFVSDRNREVSKRQLALSLKNSNVIFAPLNVSKDKPVDYPKTDQTYHLACVSRLDCNFKGQDILFQILGNEKWYQRNWRLNLYGKGDDKKYLEELAKFFSIQQKVSFKGHVNSIRDIWAENHIMVMPSIAEGTPCALMEAMLCGRSAVATDVGGNSEFVKEGETGFLAASPSPKYFEEALDKAWDQRENWQLMGNNAYQLAIKKIHPNPGSQLLDYITQN